MTMDFFKPRVPEDLSEVEAPKTTRGWHAVINPKNLLINIIPVGEGVPNHVLDETCFCKPQWDHSDSSILEHNQVLKEDTQ